MTLQGKPLMGLNLKLTLMVSNIQILALFSEQKPHRKMLSRQLSPEK